MTQRALLLACYWCLIAALSSGCDAYQLPEAITQEVSAALMRKHGSGYVAYFRGMLADLGNSTMDDSNDLHIMPPLDDTDERQITLSLKPDEQTIYHRMVSIPGAEGQERLTQAVMRLVKTEWRKVKAMRDKFLTPNQARFQEINALAKQLPFAKGGNAYNNQNTDTPCGSAAECERMQEIVNKCYFIRNGAQTGYNMFSMINSVLATLMGVLCACIFVYKVQVCALINFAYACVFPGKVSLHSSVHRSGSIWEAVKATTTQCRMYGAPQVSMLPGL
ncbi:unnamed protein product [Vitrella brassicaformis CCMP3155]|uniref:Uncharacterized protein n=1 Tax=Vitrella brassicaformis (strain CCMP3155) TaxID=1169540 RepID=A0A0G4GFP2_VITBC|nr:unnamed protein product [Vitrella brassicaformis CCMP3155]|eukprot:CEM28121.1 unnamed protein product [Vitrella brassicaformis CCMP3155]